jgi:hypothetical protein
MDPSSPLNGQSNKSTEKESRDRFAPFKKGKHMESTTGLNRQGRRVFDGLLVQEDWISFGDVTHAHAAELVSRKFGFVGLVETRDEGSETIFLHHVEPKVVYEVRSIRGDSND